MSRFYQKYLNGLPSKDGNAEAVEKKIDPTSMSMSSSTNAQALGKSTLRAPSCLARFYPPECICKFPAAPECRGLPLLHCTPCSCDLRNAGKN